MLKIKVKILFCFFSLVSCSNKTCKYPIELKVFALNVWGMPASYGAVDKEERMKDIGEFIQKKEFDFYLLSELWMRPDHETIKSYLDEVTFITDIGQLSNGICDGRVTPSQCSGLSIISTYAPFADTSFTKYVANSGIEYLAGKGIGRVRISQQEFTVDFFVTHTCAEEENAPCREEQVKELLGIIKESDADFVVLGGDLNVDPRMKENTYKLLNDVMVNSMEDAGFGFTNERMTTYANPDNTYSSKPENLPVVYDYIFHKANGNNSIETTFFDIPILKSNNRSFSDHEAVITHLSFCKLEEGNEEEKNDKQERRSLEEKYSKLEKMGLKGNNKFDAQMPEMEEDILDKDSSSFDKKIPELTWMKGKRGKYKLDDQRTVRPKNSAAIKCKLWPCDRFPHDIMMKSKKGKSRFDDQTRRQMRGREIKQQMQDWKPQPNHSQDHLKYKWWPCKRDKSRFDDRTTKRPNKPRPHHSQDHIKCKRWPCIRSPRDFRKRNRDALARINRNKYGGEEADK